jgi:hypothetical protein
MKDKAPRHRSNDERYLHTRAAASGKMVGRPDGATQSLRRKK